MGESFLSPSFSFTKMKPTSTQIVLTTPELLIIILSHLPFSDLLINCTAVSKTWHTTILTTPSLLRILHMHPMQPLQANVKLQWMRGGKKRNVVFHSHILDYTTYEGGNQGLLAWVVGIRVRRRLRLSL